jgi:hypothetical protein
LADIAKFLGRFREIDPRFISSADTKLAPVIAKVLAEQKRWESVPNRREPFTVPMYNMIAATAKQQSDITTLEVAMANWTLCNLYAGCRGIEWAQTSTTQAPLSMYLRNRFNNAYAFTRKNSTSIRRTKKWRQWRMETICPKHKQHQPLLYHRIHPNLATIPSANQW